MPAPQPAPRRGSARAALLVAAGLVAIAAAPALAQDASYPPIPASDLTSPVAPFVYSHDTAIANGATAEWRKMEGVAATAAADRLYIAITDIGKGMADTEGAIQYPKNPCGAVFEGALDASGDLASLTPVVIGGPFDEATSTCADDAISNPDNLFVAPNGDLWIGEDTDFHKNQVLWVWDGTTAKRFATMPAGAEVTGLRVEPDGTIFLNVQHPSATNAYPFNRATVGVITGFKAGDAFEPVGVPEGDAANTLTLAAGTYQVLGRTGEPLPGTTTSQTFGEQPTKDGSVLPDCNNPDGNMFLPTTSAGTEGYLYTNWECVPGGASKLYIRQAADGTWESIEGGQVDFSSVHGTQNNCNASVTPWNTALTSEEYPPDVQSEWDAFTATKDNLAASWGTEPDPLQLGYIVEMTPAGGEDNGIGTDLVKHYAMGRFSHEMAYVLPDATTVYFGDDGTDRVLYKFVADTAGDLSAGTLSAAKVTQDGDTLSLTWIALGSGNDADIAAALAAS